MEGFTYNFIRETKFFLLFHYVKSVQIRSFFLSVFSCIRTECRDLRGKSTYSIRIQENKDQKTLRIWTLLRSDYFSYIPGMPLLEIEVGQQSLTNLTELEHGKQAVCGPKLTLNKSTACINAMDTTHWKIERNICKE